MKMNHNLPQTQPRQLSPLEERLIIEGYRSLLADHCQLADQHASLTQFAIDTWANLQEVRRLLGLPRRPLPLAASRACATQTAAQLASANPAPANPVDNGTHDSPVSKTSCGSCAHFSRCSWLISAHSDDECDWDPSRFAAKGQSGTGKTSYHHTALAAQEP